MSLAKNTQDKFKVYFDSAHESGALDEKTKELIHIAVVLALRCETWAQSHLAVARKMGISEEELAETAQLAASVSAGTISSIAKRASRRSEPKEGKSLSDILWAAEEV